MRITTYGHCCLLIETNGKRILTDPGSFSSGFEHLANIDLVLITHEHGDHVHTDSLVRLLENNPQAQVVTNESVGRLLMAHDIPFKTVDHLDELNIDSISLKAYEGAHVEIFDRYGLVQNTGFLVAGTFFYPGDAYTIPREPIEILALPVAGPWCKLADAIRYAIAVRPKLAFPVHDAVLNTEGKRVTYPHCVRELEKEGIEFKEFDTENTIDIQ